MCLPNMAVQMQMLDVLVLASSYLYLPHLVPQCASCCIADNFIGKHCACQQTRLLPLAIYAILVAIYAIRPMGFLDDQGNDQGRKYRPHIRHHCHTHPHCESDERQR